MKKSDETTNNLENTTPDTSKGTNLVLPEHTLPDKLYIVPATNRPFFPAQIQPLLFQKEPWENTLERISKTEHQIMGLCYLEAGKDIPEISDFPAIGCAVKVHNIIDIDDQIQFVALGLQRFKIVKWLRKNPPYLAQVSYPSCTDHDDDTLKAYAMALINAIKELLPLNPLYSEELKNYLNRFSPRDPSPLADFAAAITTAPGKDLQEILETISIQRRMEKVLVLIRKEQEVAKLQSQISEEVNNRITQHQREFFLKEQLKVIQKELGISKDDKTADIEMFEKQMENKVIPEKVQKKINEEMKKFSVLEMGSPEFTITRNYLEWLTCIPWGKFSTDHLDINHARKVLDKDHDGLEDVKDRIIEFLAVGAFKGEISGSIILLVGPPGVGKTSIGKSIANALDRKFYRFSLGGMRDEAEIKGHRRTYIGAMPGKIAQAFKDVEVSNPVIMLDEIDKIGNSYQGDPASALLEVLDPSQNNDFLDHYLDVRMDLSKVLFICTANQLDTIPGPLLDRMDTIRLSGYITQEKMAIAKHHLWPKTLKKAGLTRKQLKLSEPALKHLIEGYAREAGVRHLEKLLAKLTRKVVVEILKQPDLKISVGIKELTKYLSAPYFDKEKLMKGVGIITGLAWTAMGGVTLPVEATRVHNRQAGFKLTGKLGEVMKESANIAYSYVVANTKQFGIKSNYFENAYIHLHVPEGATPKDGPSAGITMASALISLARSEKVGLLAMTGELTLTGQVLAVGGIREKVIAARRGNIKTLILPEPCRREYDELPDYIRETITIHFVKHYKEVAALLFKK